VPRLRTLGLYGPEPIQRWGRQFDALESALKMGERVKSTIDNLKNATNCGKPGGVVKNHILPNTFVKHYYAPQKLIYTKPADNSESWKQIHIDKVVTRQNFYTLTHSDGTDSITLERFFKNIEDHVPDYLSDIGINPANRGETEYWLAWFIATQGQRTPYAAKVRKDFEPSTPDDMPSAALVAKNLTEAHQTARNIFSWHWRFWSLESHQTAEEVLLGETCIFRRESGLLFNLKRQTVMGCSPNHGTQCHVLEHTSLEAELAMIRNLNKVTISANAEHHGYIYRASTPTAES
jgi:hypothetical protein